MLEIALYTSPLGVDIAGNEIYYNPDSDIVLNHAHRSFDGVAVMLASLRFDRLGSIVKIQSRMNFGIYINAAQNLWKKDR